ncbi:hypothetical protein F0U59_49345 [Archangium gephyra]|nr:hypothetical protein F0U59_49345 [Archangium gephyra]
MIAMMAGTLAIGLTWLLWPESPEPSDGGARLEETPRPAAEVSSTQREPTVESSPEPARNEVPPREAAPEPAAAERAERADPRFQVRWGENGLCGPGDGQRVAQRSALLGTFVALDAAGTTVRHDPHVDPVVLREVQVVLGAVRSPSHAPMRRIFGQELDRLSPPEVYVYRDVQQMLDVSCVNRAAIGYYDGAIHLSGDTRHGIENIKKTVVHEYVHHVLIGLGIKVPMWLHEGLAMKLAGETWWADPSLGLVAWLRNQHLPFEAMAGAFPHTADEKFAMAAYYQSLAMLEFLQDRQGDEGVAALVQALARSEVTAKEAFSSAGLTGDALEQAWKEFLARRYQERDNPMQRLHEAATRDRQ